MTRHLPLYVVVFISGASVLAIEILGTRILGPFFGVGLFLWSALITVTLAALSIGYAVGGRWADQGPSYSRLALVLGGAGMWLLLTPWLKGPLLEMLEPLGLRPAVLLAPLVLFFVPLALLGMVSPYAIRLRASDLAVVGRTAGDIYAVSTVASVVAALLTGFVLIPNMGVSRLVLCVGLFLILGSAVAIIAGRGTKRAVSSNVILLLLGGAAAGMAPLEVARPQDGLLDLRHSAYAELRVVDWGGLRFLLIDGGTHTIVENDTWKTYFPYVMALDVAKFLFPEPGHLLLVGLGGGSVAKSFDETGWAVEVVEIDREVVDLARTYFGLSDEDASVAVMDGRRYVLDTDRRYDLVVLDAFGSSSIPFHLVTREAFAEIKLRLNPGGVLALNIESDGWTGMLMRSLSATLATQFSQVIALPLVEPPNTFGNLLLFASDRDLELDEANLGRPFDYLEDEYAHMVVVERNHAWDNRFRPDTRGAPVLTDEKNPVDLWTEELNLTARRLLHQDAPWRHLAY